MAGKPAVVTLVVDSMTENLRPPRAEANDVANAILDGSNAILLGAETLRGLYPTVVAALASDPNVWNAVWENKALQELLQSQNANKEYVADNESIGDTDSQDAAVSSKKLTELSDDENETGNSQTGLMDVINNVKLTVVDMVTNVSAYFKKIFSFSSAEHTPDTADENAGSSTTDIMEREKQLSILYQKTRSGNPFSSKATRSFSKLDLTGAISKEMINLSKILFVQFLHFVSIPWIAGNLYVNFKRLLFSIFRCERDNQNDESIDLTFKGVPHQFNKVFVELVQGGHGHLVMMKKKLITKMIIVTMMDVMKQIWREICYCENEGQVIELLYSLGKSEGFGYHMLEKHIVQDW
ncbi:hypothetical protein NC651_026786 [Populus alba x Populus x berolinensis]|nr:hypothetical protein NC651_026786 [Populus alba x Populus x berolinensis]